MSRNFWDFSFENPDKIKPNHIAVYFFAIEQCNRLGWKRKFSLPSSMVMEATSIRSYNSYIKVLNDLIDYGFIELIEKSKNQFTANIIALSKFDEPIYKALDKAIIKQDTKLSESNSESTQQSNDSINKPITINQETINHKQDACEIRDSEIFQKTSEFFSQTTEVLQMRMFGDFKRIENNGKLEQFEKQTIAYIEYKQKTKEVVHRWQNYLSEWETENWIDKLKKEKSKGETEKKAFEQNKSETIKSIEL
ncbi:hypothetical protein [Algoriella sp.]|uniref:hypothetical protein n=1 Tax=Algoriella sp. TaxID=1872434 RepID=UPI002FCA30A4